MNILFWVSVGIVSLAVLVKSADYFVEGAEAIGAHFRVKPFILGVFLLGFGTSLPELIIGIVSAVKGTTEIVAGNVLGANTANILLILGVAAIAVKKAKINFNLLEFDIPLFITSAFIAALTMWDGIFTPFEGIFVLVIFCLYIAHTFSERKKEQRLIPKEIRELPRDAVRWQDIAKIAASPIFIYLGARYTVEATVVLARTLTIGTEIIAATAISLGTTLPELAVSYATVKKKKIDEMLGNIIGSNIFNILVVLGIPSLIAAISVPESTRMVTLPLMMVATAVCFVVISDRKITRGEGIALLIFYLAFMGGVLGVF